MADIKNSDSGTVKPGEGALSEEELGKVSGGVSPLFIMEKLVNVFCRGPGKAPGAGQDNGIEK